MKKQTKKYLMWGAIILSIIIMAYLGVRFLTTYPNPLTNIGIVTFTDENWDGNDLTMKLSVSSDYWGTGWNYYQWDTGDIRPGFAIGECYEKGLMYAYPQGFCFSHFNMFDLKSKTAKLTINGMEYNYTDKLTYGMQSFTVNDISLVGSGNLEIELVFNIYCRLGDEKCSGNNLQKCELKNVHIGNNFFDLMGIPQYDADLNRWIDKGEVNGKCGVGVSCPQGEIKCSDGICKISCGDECPTGQTICSDGTCKENCNKINYTLYIAIGILIVMIGGLYFLYKKYG